MTTESLSVEAVVSFLSPVDAGRLRPARDHRQYRPHLIVHDLDNERAAQDSEACDEGQCLGVSFSGDGRLLRPGVPYTVRLILLYHPAIDYGQLRPGATFSIREGPRTVGHGKVSRGVD